MKLETNVNFEATRLKLRDHLGVPGVDHDNIKINLTEIRCSGATVGASGREQSPIAEFSGH